MGTELEPDGVTVEVEIPATEPTEDNNNNGIADGIEIGAATVKADNAIAEAEAASTEAENAATTANVALQESIDNSSELQDVRSQLAANTLAINALASSLAELVALNKEAAQVTLDTASMNQERPADESPRDTHWLNRPIFGKRNRD